MDIVVQRRDGPRWLRELDDDDDDVFAAEAGFVRWSRTVNFKSQLCVVVHDVSETGAHCGPDGLRTVNRGTVNRGTIKRGQLIAGQLIAWTHNRSDN